MVSNSSSVPRRMFKKIGMSPMPSGSSRMTSSVTPGRMVGLIMPTTPRQLENAMVFLSFVCSPDVALAKSGTAAPALRHSPSKSGVKALKAPCGLRALPPVVPLRRAGRHISLGHIAGKRGAVAAVRVAVSAAAGALQEKALAGFHLDAGRGLGLQFLPGAEPQHEARAGAGLAAGETLRREAGLVEAAHHNRVLQQLVFALHGEPAAPLPG